MLRFAFFGSDEIALPALDAILAESERGGFRCEIPLVVSQPDRPSGRGREVRANAVVRWARERGILFLQPERPGPEVTFSLREHGCDAALVMAYGCILKPDLLNGPPLGVFNLHASLLPQFRGASPIEAAITAGLSQTGVCLQRVVAKLDAGPVVDAERVELLPDETRASLREKIAAACIPLLRRTLPGIASRAVAGGPQDEAQATYARKITREDSGIDFTAPAREIAARVRALQPWPGVVLPWDEGTVLKIGSAVAESPDMWRVPGATDAMHGVRANACEDSAAAPGTVLPDVPMASGGAFSDGLRIATGRGVLRVLQLQRPGGKMLPAAQFLLGFPIRAGHRFPSRAMPALFGRRS
ncbi:MAG: hypothetical protein LBG65_03005 [Puniceicoccales bacterium]|jgi:methionyl-tRNA formyltransferase|nr:hypothetical protein [Puniceicoccales bacterium]